MSKTIMSNSLWNNSCRVFLRQGLNTSSKRPLIRSIFPGTKKFQSHWTMAVSNAEKVVGYPTSFLSLRYLMSDEISNIAVYLKKLIGTGHPLLSTAKKLVYSKDHNHQTRGLLVLLVSKASNKAGEASSAGTGGISANQRSLAEITELIHTAHLIHSGVINLRAPVDENLEMGNKMAILCGDFLLAHACVALASLQNVKVVELISQAISDISTAEFVELTSDNKNPLDQWREQAKLRYGSLLAHACQSTLLLGGASTSLIGQGHAFGLEIALAWQANIELKSYQNASGPQRNQHLLSELFPSGTNSSTISSSLEEIRDTHADQAVQLLREFPQNDATLALINIVRALKH